LVPNQFFGLVKRRQFLSEQRRKNHPLGEGREFDSMKITIPHVKLVNPFKRGRVSTTGSGATALNTRQVISPGQAQGSGSLQATEAVSYGSVPLAYAQTEVPRAKNVGKPLSQRVNFVAPLLQRFRPLAKPKAKIARNGR
jgi:hypothetical protein